MDIEELIPSWVLALQAGNKSPKTIEDYVRGARRYRHWAEAEGEPTDVEKITKAHVQAFVANLVRTRAPATAETYFKYIQQFFRWCTDEGEIDSNPMASLRRPDVPESLVPVIPDDDLVRLLKVCEGRDFKERRDAAIIRVLLDTGVRVGGLLSMAEKGLNLHEQTAVVILKGRDEHVVPFGVKTANAIDRYLRVRRRHPFHRLGALWLGQRGALGGVAVREMVARRARQAGIGHVHPHQFRHTAANAWLANDGGETDLMTLMGWTSRNMLGRYARSAAKQRARDAHRRMGLGDRL